LAAPSVVDAKQRQAAVLLYRSNLPKQHRAMLPFKHSLVPEAIPQTPYSGTFLVAAVFLNVRKKGCQFSPPKRRLAPVV
jgi:hypothetical protein